MKHRDTRYWSFWDKDVVIFKSVNDGIVAFWRHPMTEDIVVLEMQMMVTVAFEGMQWLKTLSSSKCKWWSLLPLKAYNDWRHCLLRNVNEGIVAFWRHAMIEDIVVFEIKMRSLLRFEGMQWLKTLSSSKCRWRHCRLLKACNDWRHCLLLNVNEGIVAFWRHAMTKDIVVF